MAIWWRHAHRNSQTALSERKGTLSHSFKCACNFKFQLQKVFAAHAVRGNWDLGARLSTARKLVLAKLRQKGRIRSMMMSRAVLLFTFEDCKTIQLIQNLHWCDIIIERIRPICLSLVTIVVRYYFSLTVFLKFHCLAQLFFNICPI